LLATPGDIDEACIADGFGDVLNDAGRDLVAAGQLKQEEYERLTMPVYFRTVEELVAPLQRHDSPVRGAFAVDRAQALEVPTPFVAEFRRSGNASVYAATYTGFLRAITEPVVRAALNQAAGQGSTIDRFYDRVRARLQSDPERYMWRYIVVATLLTRR
jgi:hypothetical protein